MDKYNDYKIHIAKKGDSTQSICAQYSVSENDLVKANPGINLSPFGGGFFSAPKFRLDIKQGDHVRIPFHNKDKDKKGVKTIRGKKSVKVGVWEHYEVTEWYEGTPKEERNPSKVKWDLYLMKNGTKPELVLQKEEGKIRFQEKAIGNKFKVVGYLHEPELNNSSAILINVEASEKREILNIKVSDSKNQPIKGPLSYGQDINIHVETTGMKGEYVYISLWEDDVNGSGHSSSQNSKNKVIKDKKSLVGTKGIAHEIFKIEPDFKKIANAYLSKGDSSEGSTHEYYVTAYASGESKASPNINVRNPDYQQKRKEETSQHIEGKGQPQKTNTPPYKAKPGTTQPTQTKGISKVTLTKNGSKQLLATIYSKGLTGKKVRFQVLEHDNSGSDQLVDQTHTLNNDVYKIDIFLDRIDQSKGGGFWSEGYEQELFIDVEVLETHTHIESHKVNVDINAFKVEVAESKTVAKVGDSKTTKKDEKNVCFCKQEENQFYWSDKLTCEQRKKVLEVCASIWGESKKKEKASELMSVIHLETGNTPFSPSADNGAGYSGLIQFSDGAAKVIGTTRTALKKMTFIEQMDYVKKYLEKKKGQLNTMTDLYLMVLKPNAVGQGNNSGYVLFDESISVPDGDGSKTSSEQRKKNIQNEPWVTKYGYASNPSFMTEADEKTKRKKWVYTRQAYEQRAGFVNGKTTVGEVAKVLKEEHYNKGKVNIFHGECKNVKEEKKKENNTRAPWMKIAINMAKEMKGCKESNEPMYSKAKSFLKYCGNSFEPTDGENGPWCAAFMNWCIGQTTNEKSKNTYSHSKSASSLAPLDKNLGKKYKKISEPVYGCLVVYKHISKWKGHTGFLYGKTKSGEYILIGGNQDDTIRFDSYGEYTSSTKKKKLYGFYIPADYDITESDKLNENDIYNNAKEINEQYKIVTKESTGKTN